MSLSSKTAKEITELLTTTVREKIKNLSTKGLYDLKSGEILVGEEFWNFVANDKIYEVLLDLFQKVGKELRDEIDKRFAEFR